MAMKTNVIPIRMTAHLCIGANSPVVSPHMGVIMNYCYLYDKRLGTVGSLSGVPDYFGRNKISSGGDLSHYSSASLY